MLEGNESPTPSFSAPLLAPNSSKNTEDIMSVLLQHEKRGGQSQTNLATSSLKQNDESSDSSGEEPDQMGIPDFYNPLAGKL